MSGPKVVPEATFENLLKKFLKDLEVTKILLTFAPAI